MFERREEIEQMVEGLVELCRPLGRGDLLTREAIQAVVGVEPNTAHWGHVVKRARRRVERERGIATWYVTGHGFRLLTQDEQLTFLPKKRRLKAVRQFRRSRASVAALPVEGLSLHQMDVRAKQLASLKRSEAAVREEIELAAVTTRVTETLPRARPIPRPAESLAPC